MQTIGAECVVAYRSCTTAQWLICFVNILNAWAVGWISLPRRTGLHSSEDCFVFMDWCCWIGFIIAFLFIWIKSGDYHLSTCEKSNYWLMKKILSAVGSKFDDVRWIESRQLLGYKNRTDAHYTIVLNRLERFYKFLTKFWLLWFLYTIYSLSRQWFFLFSLCTCRI